MVKSLELVGLDPIVFGVRDSNKLQCQINFVPPKHQGTKVH